MNLVGEVREKLHLKEFRHLTTVAIIFVSVLLISNVASSKILSFGVFDFDGGTILFPLSYIFGDILTEVYGYKRVRRIIWVGLLMNVLMAAVFVVVGWLPPSQDWGNQDAYMAILGWTPRIVFASVVAYFVGEFTNSYVLAKIKVWMKGKKLWVRTISSTIIGQGFDTLIFVLLAFYGVLPNSLLIAVIVSNYIFKVGVEVLFTPITYLIVGKLKKDEGVDVYDKDTNFNPFRIE
ncbi:MAG: queuosine precursor transporter [Candidatus Gracilibacteria bacterium]|nr:queuosine precursor transporter [Candidatus Gracilibacteria bacterium]